MEPLPIPHITDHMLADADLETRDSLRLFATLVTGLEPALKQQIRFNSGVQLEFPQIAVSYLLASLQRIRVISWGVITALNAPNEILFVMAVRSIIESAANLCYLRTNLEKTYACEISRKDMTYLALRMKFATRKADDQGLTSEEATLVSSVNVLTAVKALDRYAASECEFTNEKPITSWYERLCEFSHPNALGNSIGSDLNFAEGQETFEIEPTIRSDILPLFSNYTFVSLYLFCRLYSDVWNLLFDAGESLPTWEPPSHHLIVLE